MSLVFKIAYTCREFVRERLLNKTNGFNGNIASAAQFYGTTSFQIVPGSNLYLGRVSLVNLIRSTNPNPFPAVVLSAVKSDSTGRQAMRITPSVFSGAVIVSIDFHTSFGGNSKVPVDGEANFFAQESAFTTAMNSPDAYTATPPNVNYNNEVLSEQGPLEWDGTRWLQTNSFAVIMNRET